VLKELAFALKWKWFELRARTAYVRVKGAASTSLYIRSTWKSDSEAQTTSDRPIPGIVMTVVTRAIVKSRIFRLWLRKCLQSIDMRIAISVKRTRDTINSEISERK
jgi:hypothetical protein